MSQMPIDDLYPPALVKRANLAGCGTLFAPEGRISDRVPR